MEKAKKHKQKQLVQAINDQISTAPIEVQSQTTTNLAVNREKDNQVRDFEIEVDNDLTDMFSFDKMSQFEDELFI